MRSHEVAGKGYVFTKTSQMASIGVIFTSTYHTKQLNPWPNQPIMLLFLSIMLCCSALKIHLLRSRTRILAYNFARQFTTYCRQFLYKAILLECINETFTTIFHKCLILLLIFALHFLIMLALCLMLSITHYAQTGIKAGSYSQ